mmetsp:Transcript_1170/g.2456  ORF Transcript_1170/g.2456 Transcript_1170/m.2456 type:complete len:511 (-) Transcript_1170:246-1778(-)
MTAAAGRCSCKEQLPITMSTGRRRHHCSSSSVASFVSLVVAAVIGTSSAFVPHRSPSPSFASMSTINYKSFVPAVPCNRVLSTRIRGKSTSLFVSLGSPTSTVPPESDELTEDVKVQSNVTFSDISKDLSIEVTSESSLLEVVIPLDEADEQHMESVRMGDDVEELTHLLAPSELDLQMLVSPSIPISYDDHGMAQADAAPFAPAVPINEIAIGANNGSMIIANNESEDYPPFIKFLFQKDANGQTLASKLFNLALLAASFGFVFVSVFTIDRGMTRGWSPAEIGMRIPLDTWASYENSLSEKPVATKTIINIVIYLLGDWLSQTLFQQKNILDFDAARTLKNGFIGMCFGPAVHEYYEFSDWILPVDGVTIGITNRAFKILMDQTVYLSIKCSIYILAIGVLNGESVESSSENVKNRIKPIMFAAWKFWPLVHCVTYGLIPARHRILWVNSVDLVWNAILASKARDDDGEDNDSDGGSDGLDDQGDILELNSEEGFDLFQKKWVLAIKF